MSKISLNILILVILFASPIFINGQGCSDAGFCTMNSFKPNSGDTVSTLNNQIKIGTFFGKADNSINVYGSYFEYNRQFNEKFGFDLKLTSLAQNGNDISVFELSDIFINTNYRPTEKSSLTLGLKIPLNNGNKTNGTLPLPMDYQSSLGTLDLILGMGYEIDNVQMVFAMQQPLTQNKNAFIANAYPINSVLKSFQSTNSFKRSGDILARVSYPITIDDNFRITPSLLTIYHLANDKFTNSLGDEKEIMGSQGLTLNGNVFLDYEINNKNSLQVNVAMPFIVRDSRPDGLTRSFIANLEYRIKF